MGSYEDDSIWFSTAVEPLLREFWGKGCSRMAHRHVVKTNSLTTN